MKTNTMGELAAKTVVHMKHKSYDFCHTPKMEFVFYIKRGLWKLVLFGLIDSHRHSSNRWGGNLCQNLQNTMKNSDADIRMCGMPAQLADACHDGGSLDEKTRRLIKSHCCWRRHRGCD
jgi:hypothetical protein